MGFGRSWPGRVRRLDLSMAGEDTGAAIRLVQSYAGTRPVAACRAIEKWTFAVLAEPPGNVPKRFGGVRHDE